MSNTVIASIKPTTASPQRIVGEVTIDKATGFVTVQYREPGKIKATPLRFDPADLAAYVVGPGGYIVAMTTNAVATMVGELVVKGDKTYLKTAEGNVVLQKMPGMSIEYAPVDPESREARQAEKASKVKIRGARAAAAASGEKGSTRAERRAARAAKPAAGEAPRKARDKKKAVVTEEAPARKKKKR